MTEVASVNMDMNTMMYIAGFIMLILFYVYKQFQTLIRAQRDIEVWEIDGKNIDVHYAKYYPDDGVAIRRGAGPYRSIAVKYIINERHMLYKVKRIFFGLIKTLQPMVLVDVRTRKTIDPVTGKPTGHIVNQLDYLTERNFWLALMTRIKVPLSVWIIGMFMGAGVYSVLRLILASLGLHVP